MITLDVKTGKRCQMMDVTDSVNSEIKRLAVLSGTALIHVPHTTCGITVNEGFDPHVREDILNILGELSPRDHDYRHLEGNSDAHIKTLLTGTSVIIPIMDGVLATGQWQRIFICEFDGPRNRKLFIKISAD